MHRSADRLATVVVLFLAFSECSRQKPAPLPDLPELAFESMIPVIREQIQKVYHRAQENPTDATANGHLGMVLHAYGQYESAEPYYHRGHLLQPDEFRWAYYLGTVRFFLGNDAAAAAALRVALRMDPQYYAARLRLAETLLALGELEECERMYRSVTKERPGSALAHYGLGRVESAHGRSVAAISHYRQACQLSETFAAAHYALALAYRDIGKTAKSETYFSLYEKYSSVKQVLEDPFLYEVTELETAAADDHFRRGLSLADADSLPQAVAAFERALEINPELMPAHVNLISLYGRLGQTDRAEQQYRTAVRIDPSRADLYHNFGVLMAEQGKIQAATRAFRKALEVEPSYAEAHSSLGEMLEAQGRLEEATKHYRLAVKNKSNFRLAHSNLGRMLFALGEYEEAIEHFLSTLTPEDEQTAEYMYNLAIAFANSGDRQKAAYYARQAQQRAASLGQTELAALAEEILRKLGAEGS